MAYYQSISTKEQLPKQSMNVLTNIGICTFYEDKKHFLNKSDRVVHPEFWLEQLPDSFIQKDPKQLVMEQGKIYSIEYGGNTQILGRFKESDTTSHYFYDLLHYWNGYESFKANGQYCTKSGITNIRRGTKSEIHNLVNKEIENDCI